MRIEAAAGSETDGLEIFSAGAFHHRLRLTVP
jgi:hypothetical protein